MGALVGGMGDAVSKIDYQDIVTDWLNPFCASPQNDPRIQVTHSDDKRCPGHDINLILIDASQDAGYCLCIHPFQQVISFAGTTCKWCDQPVTEDGTYGPGAKDARTVAVRTVLGSGCPGVTS